MKVNRYLKLSLCALCAFVISASTANASMKVGPLLGYVITDAEVDTPAGSTVTVDAASGFMVGGAFEYGFDEMFFFQPELYYIRKGADVQTTIAGGSQTNFSLETSLDYIEIPLLAKVKFMMDDFGFYALFGPSIAFEISTNETTAVNNLGSVGFGSLQDTSGIDFGLVGGIGGQYMIMAGTDLFLDVRYSLGLTNIDDDTQADSWKNRNWQFILGALFEI